MKRIHCPACGTANRVRWRSLQRIAVCGRCRTPLPESPGRRGLRRALQGRYWILAGGLSGSVLLAGQQWLPASLAFAGLSALPLLATGVLGLHHAVARGRRSGSPPAAPVAPPAPAAPVDAELDRLLRRLIPLAWGPRDLLQDVGWVLSPAALPDARGPEGLLRALLDHVRATAPGLAVPLLTPRLRFQDHPPAAGQFVVGADGGVTITLAADFFLDRAAARAILCHELCHYVLEANGLREPTPTANERLTDVAMFVVGLGDVFLAGYHRVPNGNRAGHRLGYLSDAEYAQVDRRVRAWRRSGARQPSREADLDQQVRQRLPDARVRARLLAALQARDPTADRVTLLQRLLAELERDRR